jgi:hypothetical protein
MSIDLKGLQQCVAEANTLSSKPNLTKGEERRYNFLLSAISVIKVGGASLRELEHEDRNEIRARYKLPQVAGSGLTEEQETRAMGFKSFIKNERAMTEGDGLSRIGTYSGLGYFVPNAWLNRLYSAMAAHDPLFDPDVVTVVRNRTRFTTSLGD